MQQIKIVLSLVLLIICLVTFAAAYYAVWSKALPLNEAILAAPLVIVAAAAGLIALFMLCDPTSDETFELSSHWGGLGAGLGGWQLSRPAAMTLIMFVAVLGLVFVTIPRSADSPTAAAPSVAAPGQPVAQVQSAVPAPAAAPK